METPNVRKICKKCEEKKRHKNHIAIEKCDKEYRKMGKGKCPIPEAHHEFEE